MNANKKNSVSKKSILVVEDEEIIREMTMDYLQGCGYQVECAGDGEQALKIINSDHRFDLLLSDMNLPGGIKGTDLAQDALKTNNNIKVLFVTGYAKSPIELSGNVVPELLMKPYSLLELNNKINEMLA